LDMWFLRYVSGQTHKQTDKQTYTLITIPRPATENEVKAYK